MAKSNAIHTLVNVLKESLLIVYVIIMVLFIVASLGLGFLFLDSVNKNEIDEYQDQILMEEWKQEEEKRRGLDK